MSQVLTTFLILNSPLSSAELHEAVITTNPNKISKSMTKTAFQGKLKSLQQQHAQLIRRKNRPQKNGNGIFDRHEFPVLTADHTPLTWRYDFDPASNPHLMTRLGVNCVFNVGAMEWNGKNILMARVEGWDRKSFFAVAESKNGVDNFQFWDYPVRMPELEAKETNLYDMRLVRHEDGWIYGLFCAERHDDSKPNDLSAAIARGGIARTKDLVKWERLPDLKTPALHQRNCVLHPEFVNGKYAFYTRPMADFSATGRKKKSSLTRAFITRSRKAKMARARRRSKPKRAGCISRMPCATRRRECVMSFTCFCAT
jgi:hypothetical protein